MNKLPKKFKYTLALDPSGNYKEGSGTTGWCFGADRITSAGYISATNSPSQEAFWAEQLKLIKNFHEMYKSNLVLVMEDYLLYADKASAQINSRMETCKLIGAIQMYCFSNGLNLVLQNASEVKTRWSNDILLAKGIILKKDRSSYLPLDPPLRINRHTIDSIRHWTHFNTFKNTVEESHTDKKQVRSTAKY